MTPPERRLWSALKAQTFDHAHFRRQASIGPYIADFAWLSGKLVIELDGDTHGSDEAVEHDRRRDAFLSREGFHVLRFGNRDVIENLEGVVAAIAAEVKARD